MVKLFCIILSTSVSIFSAPKLAGWKLSHNINNVQVWQLESNSDVTGSLEKSKTKKIDWSQINTQDFFKSIEKKKKEMLFFIGISEWNAHEYKWTTKNDYYELAVKGTYKDSSGKNISFYELHLYKDREKIQILHTRPTSIPNGDKLSREIVGHLFKQSGF